MRQVVIEMTLTAGVADAIAQAQALGAAGDLTLNGVAVSGGVATLTPARRVLITSVGNDSALIFTVYGTNGSGATISEAVAGTNALSAYTNQDFKTVTRVASDGATAANVTVGTNDIASSIWQLADTWFDYQTIGIMGEVTDGAPLWTIETTQASLFPKLPIYSPGFDQTPPVPLAVPWPSLTNEAGAAQGAIAGAAIQAWRVKLSAAGSVRVTGVQQGIQA